MRAISARRLRRTCASSTITSTASKKRSTAGIIGRKAFRKSSGVRLPGSWRSVSSAVCKRRVKLLLRRLSAGQRLVSLRRRPARAAYDAHAAGVRRQDAVPIGAGNPRRELAHRLGSPRRVGALYRDDRVDHIEAFPALQQPVAQALNDEVQAGCLALRAGGDGQPCRCLRQCLAQVDFQAIGAQRLHQPQRRPPLGKGVLGAGRRQPGGKQARQRVQPVRHAHHQPGLALRQRIAGKARQVVLVDRLRHRLALPGCQRIVAPDDALQRGHLDHHARRQVGLAQLGCPAGNRRIRVVQAQRRRQRLHQRRHPLALVQHRAQLGLEDQRAQAGQEIRQLVLAVIAHEEIRIGKAGAQHVLVALHDQLTAPGRDHPRWRVC